MRYELAVRLCGAVAVLGLAACGSRMGASGAQPRDSVQVGYGTQAPTNVTASVSSVTPDAQGLSSTNMVDYLEGRVAGLRVIRLNGGDVRLVVRGGATFGGGDGRALLVVDDKMIENGVGTVLNSLRPEDVVRVDVLKDASAAIYGSRGANGVVLITTRRRR